MGLDSLCSFAIDLTAMKRGPHMTDTSTPVWPQPLKRLLPDKELCVIYGGICKTTLWRLRRRDPTFPKPVRATPGLNGTPEDLVLAHLERLQNRAA